VYTRLKNIVDTVLSFRDTEELIGIFPHLGADGDALGSGLSLVLAFGKLNINAVLLLDEEPVSQLQFLPCLDLIKVYTPDMLAEYSEKIKLALAVDCHQSERMGIRAKLFQRISQQAIIDHHVHAGDYGEFAVIDTGASSTAELVYNFIELLEKETGEELFSKDIAVLLLVGLVTDTGRFSFPSTTARSFEQMARLMEFKPNLTSIHYELYERIGLPQMLLRGEVLSRIKASSDSRVVASSIPQSLLTKIGACIDDLDTLPSEMRTIEGVEVAFLLREANETGAVKVNIRSNKCFDSATYAMKYGGGGHVRAAGMTLRNISLSEAEDMVMREAAEILRKCDSQVDR